VEATTIIELCAITGPAKAGGKGLPSTDDRKLTGMALSATQDVSSVGRERENKCSNNKSVMMKATESKDYNAIIGSCKRLAEEEYANPLVKKSKLS
jgi:hypothetical protein